MKKTSVANIHGRRSKNVFRETTKPIYHDREFQNIPIRNMNNYTEYYEDIATYCRTIAK